MSAATLTVVRDEMEANIVCGLLVSAGIRCSHQNTVMSALWPVGSTSPIEVIVEERDLATARKVLERRRR